MKLRAKILLFCWSVQKSSEFRFVCWANLINLFCVPKRKSSKLTKAKVNWISWEQFSSQTDSFKIYIEMGKIIKTKIAKIYILVLFKPPFRYIHHQWNCNVVLPHRLCVIKEYCVIFKPFYWSSKGFFALIKEIFD